MGGLRDTSPITDEWVPQLQNLAMVGRIFAFIYFISSYFFGILVGITPRAVALLSSELRAASEKVQWRRDCPPFSWSHSTVFQKKKKKYETAVTRHCFKLTDNTILYWWLNLFQRVFSLRVRARANIFIGAYAFHLFCRLCIILGVLVKTWIP